MTALWAVLAFLIGWKAAGSGGSPAHAASSAVSSTATGAKNAVHQAMTQAANTVWATVWTVAWHVLLITGLALAVVYGGSLVLRRARRNVTGR